MESKLNESNDDGKVIIIGAGVAGLRIAQCLSERNIQFVILEYSDYIGGRFKSLEFGGQIVDAGPGWVHGVNDLGEDSNPIWKLA